jgi:hypothetical protein
MQRLYKKGNDKKWIEKHYAKYHMDYTSSAQKTMEK